MTPIDGSYVYRFLPRRRADGHKGTFGRLLIVGGAVGYTGAPYLTALSAIRSGCGLVYLCVPRAIWGAEAARCVSAMPVPLPDDGERLTLDALVPIQEKLRDCDVLALGPGLGRSPDITALVRGLLRETGRDVVLDADALNALAGDLSALDARKGRVTVLTPHDGELARLLGTTPETLAQRPREEIAREFAVRHGCTLVRKGHRTLVALPDGTVLENTCGGSALAKGGSGDVLTGVIAALLAQGATAEHAAACGVWLHARAGDLLSEKLTDYSVTPEDVTRCGLSMAFREALGCGNADESGF